MRRRDGARRHAAQWLLQSAALWLLALLPAVMAACPRAPAAYAGGAGYNLDGISVLVETGDATMDQAERIALAVLGHDFGGETHVASAGYYDNPWIRDSFAWGMIPADGASSVGAYQDSELRFWLARQQPFGGWLTAPRSGYFDETPIFIAAVLDAYRISGNLALVRTALPQLERGWRWLAHGFIRPSMGSSVLIYANVPPHTAADWVDQVARHGYATQLEALWYWATRSLGAMEALVGHAAAAGTYARFAARIRRDINRLLWTTEAPFATGAPQVAPFGHYRSWLGGHDYFELDSNALCILYGIADREQATSIDHFIEVHAGYLLGTNGGSGVPARVVYGNYAPGDYAGKHGRLGPGLYQSAAWPSVGALVALALARTGDRKGALAILRRLSAVFVATGDIREWYGADGAGQGAPSFSWAARMFILALYDSYLGVNSYDGHAGPYVPPGVRLQAPLGPGSATLEYHGRAVAISVEGSGMRVRIIIGGKPRRLAVVPGPLLCAGCSLRALWDG